MARQPQTLVPRFSRPRTELPTIVVLLDISGSMDRYARLMLHYVHGLTRRYLQGPHAHLRHAPDQHHARAAPPRSRPRAGSWPSAQVRGLEGRHADRIVPRRLQPPLGAAPARRATPRCCWSPTASTATSTASSTRAAQAAAPVRAPDRLAQPAAALRPLRAARRPACVRCCRTSTASCRCTTWPAWPISPWPCAQRPPPRRPR